MEEFVANEEAREAHTGEMYMAQQFLRDVVARTRLDLQSQGYERALQEENQARQEDIAWYEAEMEKRSRAEAETLAMVQDSISQQLAQKEAIYKRLIGEEQGRASEAQQLLGQAQEEYQGLRAQMEREGLTAQEQRMALEAEIRTLKETRDAEIAQGLSIKNAESERLQKERDDLQSQVGRLQADIDQSKAQIKQWSESSILKREHESQIKELNRQIKDKEARIEGYKDYIGKKLTAAEEAITTFKQQPDIEEMKRQQEQQLQQVSDIFDEERQALRSKLVQAELS